MRQPCHQPPPDKRAFSQGVAAKLSRTHGRQPFYSPDQVRTAVLDLGYRVDSVCWAMVLFTSPVDFESDHLARGEVCDYGAMKEVMLGGMTEGGGFDLSWLSLPSIDLSWLDWGERLGGWFDWKP